VPPSPTGGALVSHSYHNGGTSERMFPSTSWHWKEGRLAPAATPASQSRPKVESFLGLRARDPRRSLDLQIKYIGGPEGTWEIRARGWRWRFSGGLSVADVLAWINRSDA
jgi:hypothetical protein